MPARQCRSVFLCALLISADACADDWPEVMGPGRSGISQETGWNTDWNNKEPPLLWKFQAGPGASSCVVSGGRMYTMGSRGDQESVLCLDAASGKEIWRQMYDCKFDKRSWDGGPAVTPVLDGERLYTLSFRGQLFCWNAKDGTKLWERHLVDDLHGLKPNWGWAGSPLVVSDKLIVEPGGKGTSRTALDKLTGETLWQSGNDPVAYASPILFSGPALSGVAFFNAAGLSGVDPRDGTELFRQRWKTDFDVNAVIPVQRDGKFFIGSAYGRGIALIDARSGPVWKNEKLIIHFQSPVLLGDHLYVVEGQAENPAVLTCLEWSTGKVCWRHRAGHERAHLIAVGSKLLVITQDGELVLAEASPAAGNELGRFQAIPKTVFSPPAFSDHRLFIRNNSGTVICYDMTR
ncbi:MAG TPA: PQQ-binding-like beta-propeller repeat protein [Verrucomicrobiales bacterium]|nr:PQQ-binding-like beta-propeller repeat protein [Verrucomicrobiales bacterium]